MEGKRFVQIEMKAFEFVVEKGGVVFTLRIVERGIGFMRMIMMGWQVRFGSSRTNNKEKSL